MTENQIFSRMLSGILFFMIITLVSLSCLRINEALDLPEDGFPEEIIESVIEGYTGISLDITPDSEED